MPPTRVQIHSHLTGQVCAEQGREIRTGGRAGGGNGLVVVEQDDRHEWVGGGRDPVGVQLYRQGGRRVPAVGVPVEP